MSTAARAKAPLSGRQWFLALALGATVAACVWAAQLPDADELPELSGLAEAASPQRTRLQPAAPSGSGHGQPLRWALSPRQDWPEAAPAALSAWQPAPPQQAPTSPLPVATAQPAAAAPQAPAFPYQLIGLLVQEGRVLALLGSEQRSLAVQAGDTIDGQWRVQTVGDSTLELLWLPGSLPQTLQFRPL